MKTGTDVLVVFIVFPFLSALLIKSFDLSGYMPFIFIVFWVLFGLIYVYSRKSDEKEDDRK
jgi:phosphate starvation-inducible membrane PsiE